MAKAEVIGIARIREFIAKARWKNTNYGGAEHAYTHRDWTQDEDFAGIVTAIRQTGYKAKFRGHYYTYLDVDGYQYWTMGWPVAKTFILNRARKEQDDSRVSVRPAAPGGAATAEAEEEKG